MGAAKMVQQWTAAVKDLLGGLHRHSLNAFACFSLAMCQADHCHSGRLGRR